MSRFCVQVNWDEVPHLTADQKKSLWESIPPHQRDARSKGMPVLGAGMIYPVQESAVVVDPFAIPAHWPRAYGLDVGWNRTAAIWGAWDRDSDVVYLYSEYYAGQQPPAVHASGIRSRGDWIPGVIDPASSGASQKDGSRLVDEYRAGGLNLGYADNTVEAGLFACYQRLASGGMKVFGNCANWLAEFRIYRRDDKGRVVKEHDHLMDATRYLIMSGMARAIVEPVIVEEAEHEMRAKWGRNDVTGY